MDDEYLTQENEDESHLDDTDFDEEGLQWLEDCVAKTVLIW